MSNIFGLAFDSINESSIPPNARMKLLYINGRFAAVPKYGRGRQYIDVLNNAPDKAGWLDVERFDASPADVPGWLDRRAHYGQGGIYCNRSNLTEVQRQAGKRQYYLWIATDDGTIMQSVAGGGTLVMCQAFPASFIGPNVDISVVVNQAWWQAHALLGG